MLDVDPKERPTALQLCKHPWFANMDQLPNIKLSNIQDYNLVRVSAIMANMRSERIDSIFPLA